MFINSFLSVNSKYNPNFLAYEKTFLMIKPDAFNRQLDKTIIEEVNKSGLSVIREWEGVPSKSKIEQNYEAYKSKSFFKDWIDFLTSNKIKAFILGGDDAVNKALELKRNIRKKYAPNEKRYNLVHSSDNILDAEREIANFFDLNA